MSYLYRNSWEEASERLKELESIEDEATFRFLETTQVCAGWRCLEVGAGADSVAYWLCKRVGVTGKVIATDIDTGLLSSDGYPQLEILKHDIATDPWCDGQLDLIHVRHVLFHVPEPRRAECVENLVSHLRAGGWLLLEDSDFVTNAPAQCIDRSQAELYSQVLARIFELYQAKGLDPHFGSKLYALMRRNGVAIQAAEGRMRFVNGGTPEAMLHQRTYRQLRSEVLEAGLFDDSQYDRFLSLYDDPTFVCQTRMTISVLGRFALATV